MITLQQFHSFARVNPVTQEIVEYPFSLLEVKKLTPIVTLVDLINHPPAGVISVLITDRNSIEHTEMQKLIEVNPVKIGVNWHQAFEVVDKSIEEIDALVKDVRVRKEQEINAARLTANNSYFVFDGKQIACDTLSRSDIDGTNNQTININIGNPSPRMPDNWVGAWKTIDNSYVAIPDFATWQRFYAGMWNQGNIHFAHAQALKIFLSRAQSLDEIRAIHWNMETGYPKIEVTV